LILIYSIKDSPRLQYIAKIILGTILGIDFRIVIIPDDFDPSKTDIANGQIIYYGILTQGMICIPNEDLLFEDEIRNQEVYIENTEIPKLRFKKTTSEAYSIDFDLFSSAFYLISQYEYYRSSSFDTHERHDEKSSIFHKYGLYRLPVVDIYAKYL